MTWFGLAMLLVGMLLIEDARQQAHGEPTTFWDLAQQTFFNRKMPSGSLV